MYIIVGALKLFTGQMAASEILNSATQDSHTYWFPLGPEAEPEPELEPEIKPALELERKPEPELELELEPELEPEPELQLKLELERELQAAQAGQAGQAACAGSYHRESKNTEMQHLCMFPTTFTR